MTVNTIINTSGKSRLVLRSETLNICKNLRDYLNRRVNHNISELPYVNNIT